jgi:sodium-dependent dicarboxylate transporter 2/3/5
MEPTSPPELISEAEARFERARRTAGFVLAPALFLLMWLLPLGLEAPAHRLAAIASAVIVLWVCESLPMAVTALLGPLLAVVLQVAPVRRVLAPFADPIVFLFIGGFMVAEAMFVHGLDRRVAYTALSSRLVGSSAVRALVVYGAVTTAISMWISNAATTAMMFPIGLAIVSQLTGSREHSPETRRFAIAMLLTTSFGASVGGLATPVGTPPNLIGMGLIERVVGREIDFLQWVMLGLPASLLLFAVIAAIFAWTSARGLSIAPGGIEAVRRELAKLGPIGRGERNVLAAFAITVFFWVLPGLFALAGQHESPLARTLEASVPEAVAAMLGATLLFVLPVDWKARRFTLTWAQASRIDWGIVLLYGGGLSLGELAFSTGLAKALGEGLTAWSPSPSVFSLSVLFTLVAILMSETTSNTASANMIVPVAIAVAKASGVDPLAPALAATLGASMGFMMPISTPPNAIVYSSGMIPLTAMMRYGVILDLVGFVVIVAIVTLLVPVVFG